MYGNFQYLDPRVECFQKLQDPFSDILDVELGCAWCRLRVFYVNISVYFQFDIANKSTCSYKSVFHLGTNLWRNLDRTCNSAHFWAPTADASLAYASSSVETESEKAFWTKKNPICKQQQLYMYALTWRAYFIEMLSQIPSRWSRKFKPTRCFDFPNI